MQQSDPERKEGEDMDFEKKEYTEPSLVVYGEIEEITQAGLQPNADTPGGNDNTAFSPGP